MTEKVPRQHYIADQQLEA